MILHFQRPSAMMGGAIFAAVCIVCPLRSQAEVPTDGPGIAVGEAAPEFTCPDANGQMFTLGKLLQDHEAVAMVFYRSADW